MRATSFQSEQSPSKMRRIGNIFLIISTIGSMMGADSECHDIIDMYLGQTLDEDGQYEVR